MNLVILRVYILTCIITLIRKYKGAPSVNDLYGNSLARSNLFVVSSFSGNVRNSITIQCANDRHYDKDKIPVIPKRIGRLV